jgi:surface polysaccharide O-acyltransferase-like enzyme
MRSHNYCCRVQAISITNSECVSEALVIQHTQLMRSIILSCLACVAVPHFLHYLINGVIFEKKKVENKKLVLIFFTILG